MPEWIRQIIVQYSDDLKHPAGQMDTKPLVTWISV